MQPVSIGQISISRVEEMIWTISPRFLFPDMTYDDLEPYRTSRACTNPEQAVQTRTEFVNQYADTATLILGTHFAPPTALHIVSQGDSLGVTY
jgi:hypothetical protein